MKVDVYASAVIYSNKAILLVRRGLEDAHYPGRWDLPGGSLEITELTLEDVARRVVQEEVGLAVIPEVMIDNKRKGNLLRVVFAARLLDDCMNQPILAAHLLEYRWAKRHDADELSVTPHTRERLREVFDYMEYKPSTNEKFADKAA